LIFGDYLDAGKTMGLAPYGRPHPTKLFFEETGPEEMRVFPRSVSQERAALESRIERWRQNTTSSNYKSGLLTDFTASLQFETEEALLEHARWIQKHTAPQRPGPDAANAYGAELSVSLYVLRLSGARR
jgi:predicted NodU family carbamoyl transferase